MEYQASSPLLHNPPQGRCPDVYSKLVSRVQEHNQTAENKIIISIEVEKTKIQFSVLIPLADVVSGNISLNYYVLIV